MSDKDTINATHSPDATNDDNLDSVSQDSGSTDSNSPYSLRNRKFAPYSANTTKNQKKKGNNIDDKVTIDTIPAPDATESDTPNSYEQDSVSADSYLPYSLRNCKFAPYSFNTMKKQEKEGK